MGSAAQAFEVLRQVLPALRLEEGADAALREALEPMVALLAPPEGADAAAVQRSAQAMNDLRFLDGLGRILDVLAPLFPDSLGETLVQRLSGALAHRAPRACTHASAA